jgi:hypothetical protein
VEGVWRKKDLAQLVRERDGEKDYLREGCLSQRVREGDRQEESKKDYLNEGEGVSCTTKE